MSDPDLGRAGNLQTIVRRVIGPVARRLWRLEANGLEHLPETGPAILAANHTSALDSFLVPVVLPRNVTYVGKAEYLDDWKTRRLFPALGMIPLDRKGGDAAQAALDLAASILDDGELFAIYPEGTRSRTGALYKGHTGVARLSLRTGAPIIPVGLRGMREIQPPDAPLPRPFKRASIAFGEPMHPEVWGDPEENPLVYRAMTDALMFHIKELSGQQYENRYAPSAAELEAGVTDLAAPSSPVEHRRASDVLRERSSALAS